MPGVVVVTHTDSVLVAGPDGLAVTLPASALLAVDAVLTRCRREGADLVVRMYGGLEAAWQATLMRRDGAGRGFTVGPKCATPWAAVVALAAELERGG